jgi:hypothetical protein
MRHRVRLEAWEQRRGRSDRVARNWLWYATAGLMLAVSVVSPAVAQSSTATIDGGVDLRGISCPSITQCIAVGDAGNPRIPEAQEVPFNPTAPGTATPIGMGVGFGVSFVTCPSASQCTALDLVGQQLTFPPYHEHAHPRVTARIDNGILVAIACPSVLQCTAVLEPGTQEVTFNPAAALLPGAPARPSYTPTANIGTGQTGPVLIACPSVRQCTVVDNLGHEETFNPTSPPPPSAIPVDMGGGTPFGLACPRVSQCTVGDEQGREVTFNPASPGAPTPATIGEPHMEALACPSTSQCTAIGVRTAVTFNPASPSKPTPVVIKSTGANLDAVACPSARQCTAVDHGGTEVTFSPVPPASAPGYHAWRRTRCKGAYTLWSHHHRHATRSQKTGEVRALHRLHGCPLSIAK